MLRSIQQRDLKRNRWIKIAMSVILLIICATMLLYLVPGLNSGAASDSPDAVATVGGQGISVIAVQNELADMTRGQSVPAMMRGIYAQQVLNQMIFERALEIEADRLGIRVTPEEETEKIKQILPTAWSGGTWLKDRYATEVQVRTGMSVAQFEDRVRQGMLTQKFQQLVTDGITVSPAEIQQEFRRRNEKVAIQYSLIKPSELAAAIHPADAELAAYFAKNSAKYQVPEKRSVQYALLDLAQLHTRTQASDSDLRAYYAAHIDDYKVQTSAHIEHILFKTIGKTDAEMAEIRQKAADVLKQAQHGANFEDLAKKYSEDDATKAKGGDLGWIVDGQTTADVQQAAFNLPKGTVSDLLKTDYGFEIIKVLDRQVARTKTFDEVRASIAPSVVDDKVNAEANDVANKMAEAVRQSDRQPLDVLAKKFNLELSQTQPASYTEPVGDLGNSPDLHQAVFQLQPGELSQPMHLDKGIVILTVKAILPAHQGTLTEIHDRVLADYQQEKSLELARTRADELAKRAKSGEPFDKAAKALNVEMKTSEPFSRTGSVQDIGSGQQLESAFNMAVGQVSVPMEVAGNWLVYRIASHESPNQADLAKQTDEIKQQLLQGKQQAAFDAFRAALEDRLKREGKLTINADAMKSVVPQS